MSTLIAHLPAIMAAEKSKTAFYVVGGLCAAWAVFISLGVGLRRADFPSSAAAARVVMAISAVLVIATGALGVITASKPSKSETSSESAPAGAATPGGASGGTPAPGPGK
ncbi:MAG: hypothetical protein KGJ43_03980 [Acidobacteriota bacterium]|nr:hypothetical protein [Acidobacteriota bacterium]